jgi:error-prone DNA polymerase
MYVPLWCKTNFSFLEGASHPEELIETADQLGLPAIAITDRNGLYGMVRAFDAARHGKVRLITGSQVSVEDGSSVVLLAQDRAGYGNLCRLVSRGHLRNPKGTCSVSWREAGEHAQGLLALWLNDAPSAPQSRSQPQPQPQSQTRPELALPTLKEAFSDRLYAVVSRHRWVDDVARERTTRECAARFSIPLVAATEVLYHVPDRRRLQDVLVCIRHGTTLREAETKLFPNDEHALKSAAQFQELFRDSPGLAEITREIADRCRFSFEELVYKYPDEVVPSGFTTATWLRRITFEGAKERYRGGIPAPALALLKKELALIEELGYCGYFLTMRELVRFCREKEILCQGRGSAANSVVCCCLGVTSVDPVQMDLLFERFLSRERAEPPDIDLDIEHNRREEVIQHIYEKYGRDRAAMVANVVRYRKRSAIREVGKAFGVPETALDFCAKLLPHWDGDLDAVFREGGLDLPEHLREQMVELTKEITGFPRHLSIHPGGFLLGSEPVDTIVPIENATMENRTVIQWDKTDIETMNLFKVDLLGLGALTHLDYAFRLLKSHYDTDLSLATIPANDHGVYDMTCRADTVGVFQIESRAQMAMLPRLKPRNYYDLVIEVSLVRPGPITGGMVHPYLRRRAGQEAVTYPHPCLEPVLRKTLGIPLFQEQVMKLAVVAADYAPGEADQLRRDMAAWRSRGKMEGHHDRLVSRMVAKGIEPEFAERVFSQILGFGEYGFPESHAASFALIAYATAYVRHHYPVVFACALLNAWPFGFYSPATVIDDSKRHKVKFLPIDILKSDWDCTLEPRAGDEARRGGAADRGDYAVRIGLRYVKGLGDGDWQRVKAWRAGTGTGACTGAGTSSLSDFTSECRLPSDSMERLAEVGAFDCFDKERRDALWGVLDQGERPTNLLVGDFGETPSFRPLSAGEKVTWDYRASDQSPRGHVMEQFRSYLEKQGLPDTAAVSRMEHGHKVSIAGCAICRQMPSTASGVLFMTLEDESGFANLVVWEKVFKQYRTLILTNWMLGVTGRLQIAEGVAHIIAESFWKPEFVEEGPRVAASSHDFR